jgi:Flp pilus assembly protein TadG
MNDPRTRYRDLKSEPRGRVPAWGQSTSPSARRRRRRQGVQTLELVIVLPILITVLIAGIQYGIAMVVEQAVVQAATVGAREAGKGANINDLQAVVEAVLYPHDIKIGQCASVVLEDPQAAPPVQQAGALTCAPCSAPDLVAGEVRVTVCVDLSKKPFLNALKSIGICNDGKRFVVSSVVKKE